MSPEIFLCDWMTQNFDDRSCIDQALLLLSRGDPLLPLDFVGSILLGLDSFHRLIDPQILCGGQRRRLATRTERNRADRQYQIVWISSHV